MSEELYVPEPSHAKNSEGIAQPQTPDGAVRVWVSRYALSTGLKEEECWDNGDGWVVKRGSYGHAYRLDTDAHLTRAGAQAKAEIMRDKRVASLRAQIAALAALDFSDGSASDRVAEGAEPSTGRLGHK